MFYCSCDIIEHVCNLVLALESMTSRLPTRSWPNRLDQLQRLARAWKFACSKYRYNTFQEANNKGACQTSQMRRLVCAFDVRKPQIQFF